MIQIRKANERGQFDHGWLKTCHTFSFGDYQDRNQMRFRALRVINEDWVQPGQGFGMHPHRDMEIVTYVLEGALEHKDSLGNGSVLRPGEFQRMSAGTGITHSEFNPSDSEPVHLYQIWLLPERKGAQPEYEQRSLDPLARQNQLQLVASSSGLLGSMTIHQDANIYLANLQSGRRVAHLAKPDRHAWLQVLRGSISLNGQSMTEGDGAAVSEESHLEIVSDKSAEIMLFDLA